MTRFKQKVKETYPPLGGNLYQFYVHPWGVQIFELCIHGLDFRQSRWLNLKLDLVEEIVRELWFQIYHKFQKFTTLK